MRPVMPVSPTGSYGPFSLTTNMSSAVMRPSFAKPTFSRPCTAGPRAADVVLGLAIDPHHHRRVQLLRQQRRNDRVIVPVALLPNPPPVYSLMRTMSFGSRCSQRDIEPTVCTTLCVEQWMYSLPFCQYAIAVRGSSVWWLVFGVDERLVEDERRVLESRVDDRRTPTRPASCPSAAGPASYSANSASVHFSSSIAAGVTG